MKKHPKISESEWRVMQVLWQRSPLSANEIVAELADRTQWNPKTIKTLLTRLVQKKAVGYRQTGRAYQYFPKVSQDSCLVAESRSFLRRLYGGSLQPMIAKLLEYDELTDKDVQSLKRLLDTQEGAAHDND